MNGLKELARTEAKIARVPLVDVHDVLTTFVWIRTRRCPTVERNFWAEVLQDLAVEFWMLREGGNA